MELQLRGGELYESARAASSACINENFCYTEECGGEHRINIISVIFQWLYMSSKWDLLNALAVKQ
jgi:hypothetical protein